MNAPDRIRRLLQAKGGIERTIAEEQRRPAPDALRLSALKSAKLRIKDQIARMQRFATDATDAVKATRRSRARRRPASMRRVTALG